MEEVAEKLGWMWWNSSAKLLNWANPCIWQRTGGRTEGFDQSLAPPIIPMCGYRVKNHQIYENVNSTRNRMGRQTRHWYVHCHAWQRYRRLDMAAATLKMNDDGSFNLLLGATDIGTGSDTILAQIAAEVLGIPVLISSLFIRHRFHSLRQRCVRQLHHLHQRWGSEEDRPGDQETDPGACCPDAEMGKA